MDEERDDISQITDYLYLSGVRPVCLDNIEALGITCVINCIRDGDEPLLGTKIKYVHIPLDDHPKERLKAYINTVCDIIHDHRVQGGSTLVYCMAGISRSASFCISYLMLYEKMTLRDSYHAVQNQRPKICPNVGFFRQMIDLEEKLTGQKTVKIVEAAPGLFMADVVWEELSAEINEKMGVQLTLES